MELGQRFCLSFTENRGWIMTCGPEIMGTGIILKVIRWFKRGTLCLQVNRQVEKLKTLSRQKIYAFNLIRDTRRRLWEIVVEEQKEYVDFDRDTILKQYGSKGKFIDGIKINDNP
jgi:hypothetical protein